MGILMMLAPMSLLLGLLGVAAFWWTLRNRQYEDPAGDAARILIDDPGDRPPAREAHCGAQRGRSPVTLVESDRR